MRWHWRIREGRRSLPCSLYTRWRCQGRCYPSKFPYGRGAVHSHLPCSTSQMRTQGTPLRLTGAAACPLDRPSTHPSLPHWCTCPADRRWVRSHQPDRPILAGRRYIRPPSCRQLHCGSALPGTKSARSPSRCSKTLLGMPRSLFVRSTTEICPTGSCCTLSVQKCHRTCQRGTEPDVSHRSGMLIPLRMCCSRTPPRRPLCCDSCLPCIT